MNPLVCILAKGNVICIVGGNSVNYCGDQNGGLSRDEMSVVEERWVVWVGGWGCGMGGPDTLESEKIRNWKERL